MEEHGVVEKAQKGDLEAFEKLVKKHQTRIFYLGLKFCRDKIEAEDFSQEVFIRAFEKLKTFRGEAPFSAWLYRLAFNLAINRYGKKNLEEATDLSTFNIPANTDSPDITLEKKELKEKVNNVLSRLPGVYNLLVKMHFFDGLTYPQISKIIDKPINTIKSYIFRAKKIIREDMEQYMEDGND